MCVPTVSNCLLYDNVSDSGLTITYPTTSNGGDGSRPDLPRPSLGVRGSALSHEALADAARRGTLRTNTYLVQTNGVDDDGH